MTTHISRTRRRLVVSALLLVVSLSATAAASVSTPDEGGVTDDVAYTRVGRDPKGSERTWITAADLGGGSRRVITRRPDPNQRWDDYGPIWSPDGSHIAFLRVARSGSSMSLYVATRDGSSLRRVLRLPGLRLSTEAPDYSWSPDGQKLAFGNGPLYVVNRDGTGSRRLVASSTCKPSWSPDGQSIVYLVDRWGCGERGNNSADPGHEAVYRINADGSQRRQLASGSFGDAAWSPDGSQIAFTDRCEVRHGFDWACSVSLLRADGGGRRRLVTLAYGGWVEWIAEGTEVLWPADYQAFKATNIETGVTHRVLPPSIEMGYPAGLSSDGRKIAVIATDPYSMREQTPSVPPLVVVSSDTRLLQRITVPRGWKSQGAVVYLG